MELTANKSTPTRCDYKILLVDKQYQPDLDPNGKVRFEIIQCDLERVEQKLSSNTFDALILDGTLPGGSDAALVAISFNHPSLALILAISDMTTVDPTIESTFGVDGLVSKTHCDKEYVPFTLLHAIEKKKLDVKWQGAWALNLENNGNFLGSFVKKLAQATGCREAFIARLTDKNGKKVVIQTSCSGGRVIENIELDTKNSPCEKVLETKKLCFYPKEVKKLFPKDSSLQEHDFESYLAAPIFDISGKLMGYVGIRDVAPISDGLFLTSILRFFSARAVLWWKRTSDAHLKETKERYLKLVENSSDAITILDMGARFSYLNPKAVKVFGAFGNLLNNPFEKFVDPQFYPVVKQHFERALSGETSSFQYSFKRKYREVRWYNAALSPLRNANGEISEVLLTVQEISKKRHTEREVKFLREYAENILHHLPVSILVANRQCLISFANEAFFTHFKINKDKVLSRTLSEILGSNIMESLQLEEKIIGSITQRKPIPAEQYEVGGQHFNLQIVPIQEYAGRRFNAIVILEDVSQKMELEETVRQSEKMSSLGCLIAGAAHEINNPLTVVLGKLQYLLSSFHTIQFSDSGQSKKILDILESVEREAKRCAHISQNLLSFSYKGALKKQLLDINQVLQETLNMVSTELLSSNIKAIVQLSKELEPIEGNSDLLQQAFLNLITNAKQAMSVKGGTLFITSHNTDQGRVKIELKDTGPGIPKEQLARVFEPFFTTKDMGKGVGLGLSIVHSIVEKHGGMILVDSHRGEGATFTIQLPTMRRKSFWDQWS